MRLMHLLVVVCALLVLAPTSARAEWREARTDHFVLVSDLPQDQVHDFATKLERFDTALRRLYDTRDDAAARARPVTIYALQPPVFGAVCQCPMVLGYYRHPVTGPRIIMTISPREDRNLKLGDLNSQAVLLHEYSHHFMIANFPSAYPYWYIEGFAEFNGNAAFRDDGSVVIGYPANYRGAALLKGSHLPLRKLVAPEVHGFGQNVDTNYGRAWLLTHYLTLRPERSGQLGRYLALMQKGTPSLAAAQSAFGDFKTLDRELDAYQSGALAAPLRIPPAAVAPKVEQRVLSKNEAAMLIHVLSLTDGLPQGYKGIAMRAEKLARSAPDEAAVQRMAAEVNLLADRLAIADAFADKALALAPRSLETLLIKGQIAEALARAANPTDLAAFAAGRDWYRRANRAAPDHAEPFYRYYTSFAFAGATPPADAVRGLMRASLLAPESNEVSLALAWQKLRESDGVSARALLVPIASAPHRRRDENKPGAVITLIDQGEHAKASAALAELIMPQPGKD